MLGLPPTDRKRTKVQAFDESNSALTVLQREDRFKAIGELFDPVERSMQIPIADLCSRAEAYQESPELLASVCILAHLSRIVLHASMVPFLSGNCPRSLTSPESVHGHIKMVVEQAMAVVKLLQQFITRDLDITRLWYIGGYGAFIVGKVFVVSRASCQNQSSLALKTDLPSRC
jgi:hypothetical protein